MSSLAEMMTEAGLVPSSFSTVTYSATNFPRRSVEDLSVNLQFPAIAGHYMAGMPAPWTEQRGEYVKQYKGSTYIAIAAFAHMVAMQPVKVRRRVIKDNVATFEPVSPDHPLCKLLDNPNPVDTNWDLWFYMIGWRLISGDSFLYQAKNGFDVTKQLWPVPTQWVRAIPGKENYIDGYEISASPSPGIFVPVDSMVHIKNPSLDWSGTGRYYGMPAIKAAATSIDLENEMWKRLYHTFKNFAPPGMVFETEQRLQPHQARQIWGQLVAQHSMAEATGRPLLVHSGLKLAGEFTQGQRELDYTGSLDKALEYNLAVMGIPKALVGMSGLSKQDFEAQLWGFCKTRLDSVLAHMSKHLTKRLAQPLDPDLVITLGPSQVDTLDTMRQNVDTLVKSGAITPDEVRHVVMELPPLPEGQGTRPVMVSGFQQVGGPDGNPDKTVVGRAALATPPNDNTGRRGPGE